MHIVDTYSETTIINKSRFITCLSRIESEEEAREFIQDIRSQYPDATHVCTAFVTGENNQIRRSSDNGEPSGTAGVPILEAILNSNVQDVCVCVVRYFGGIKLGTGGLVRAYSGCTTTALANCPKTISVPVDRYSITYPYDLMGTLETWLRKNTDFIDSEYGESVTSRFETDSTNIIEQISDITKGQIQPILLEHTYREIKAD